MNTASPFRKYQQVKRWSSLTALVQIAIAAGLHAQSPSADSFNPSAINSSGSTVVSAFVVQPDGKILIGGSFTQIGGQGRTNIARLFPDGTVETNFHPVVLGIVSAQVNCIALQTNGQILVGGSFSTLSGQSRKNIGRLNSDGTLDTTFNPGTDTGPVRTLAVLPDGTILISGNFFMVGSQIRPSIARLNPSGSLDTNFNARASGSVLYVVPQADGKILVGGGFTQIGGQSRTNFARLNSDGSLDFSFNPGVSGIVYPHAAQPDGKIIVDVGASGATHVMRLNADGSIDPNFVVPPYCNSVGSAGLQADGKILVTGGFTSFWGQPRNYLASLNADGTLDTNFTAGADNLVLALAIQPDAKILAGGLFSILAGATRLCVGRLNNTNSLALQNLKLENSTLTWTRGGSSPEIWHACFEYSPDGLSWLPLGDGAWVSPPSPGDTGRWVLSGISLPSNAIVRARGRTTSGDYNGSSGFVESMFLPGLAIANPFRKANGQFVFSVTGPTSWRVAVESSKDFKTWTPLQTNTLGQNPLQFAESPSATNVTRFYRLRSTQ
jgi:uncharacterized delta-60 repeat protein